MPVFLTYKYVCDCCKLILHMSLPQPKRTSFLTETVLCPTCLADMQQALREMMRANYIKRHGAEIVSENT